MVQLSQISPIVPLPQGSFVAQLSLSNSPSSSIVQLLKFIHWPSYPKFPTSLNPSLGSFTRIVKLSHFQSIPYFSKLSNFPKFISYPISLDCQTWSYSINYPTSINCSTFMFSAIVQFPWLHLLLNHSRFLHFLGSIHCPTPPSSCMIPL
jgi:hypothetical protein